MADKIVKEEAFRLLVDLLEMPSVNGQDHELQKAEFISVYLQRHGILAEVHPVDGKRGNVTAWIPGRDSSITMIWNGHIDTVPYGRLTDWATDPTKAILRDGRLYGRGASDMQSGLAAMIYTLAHLRKKPCCNIQFIATCDEEKNGTGAEAILRQKQMAKDVELLLIGEPTRLNLGTAQKGCLWLEIDVQGKASHGAYPAEGINAIEHCMKLAGDIRRYVELFQHPLLGRATAQVTKISGGTVPNVTPDICTAVMDIRLVPGVTDTQVLKQAGSMAQHYAAELPGLSAELRVRNTRRAIEIDNHNIWVKRLRRLIGEQGQVSGNIGINYFTDGSILARDTDLNVLLFGPGDPAMCHKPNEYVDIEDYYLAIRVLMKFSQERLKKTDAQR